MKHKLVPKNSFLECIKFNIELRQFHYKLHYNIYNTIQVMNDLQRSF
jgi:hypothetical protein